MARVLPGSVVVVETTDPADWEAGVLPEEEALVVGAVDKRRREFAAGRQCARRALAGLGAPAVAILAGPRGEPLWPAGVVGSITHCSGFCAAAVAWQEDVRGLGIDAEVHAPVEVGVAEVVCTARERRWIESAPHGVYWEIVFLSAKESVYKAWYPLRHGRLGFEDVEVELDPGGREFSARLDSETFVGRFAIGAGHVVTSATSRPEAACTRAT